MNAPAAPAAPVFLPSPARGRVFTASGAIRGTAPLRASDFDTAGHVNNTVHWTATRRRAAASPDGPPR